MLDLFTVPPGSAVQEYIRKLKDNKPCTDCGVKYPFYVMDFDHIGPKRVDPSSLPQMRWSWLEIHKELAMCELVCSNCHRDRTYWRMQATKLERREYPGKNYDWDSDESFNVP